MTAKRKRTRPVISQREARRLQKRVAQLLQLERDRHARWSAGYPGGVNIETVQLSDVSFAKLETAQRLDFSLVCKVADGKLRIYAVKP